MSLRVLVPWLVTIVACCAPAASAEVVGKRVRVTLARGIAIPDEVRAASNRCGLNCREVEGTLVDVREDGGLIVDVKWRGAVRRVTVPPEAVDRLAVNLGQRSRDRRVGRGAIVGAFIGGVGGAMFGAGKSGTCDPEPSAGQWSLSCLELFPAVGTATHMAGYGAVGALLGAAAGSVVGAALPVERWERVPGFGGSASVRLHIRAAPDGGRAFLALRF